MQQAWSCGRTSRRISSCPCCGVQLELGAQGATCAKLGEAEGDVLGSGVKRIFIAHSLVDLRQAPRLKALASQLEQLILAVTSELQCDALDEILSAAGAPTGADGGGYGPGPRRACAVQAPRGWRAFARSSCMELISIYTHEGHALSYR